MGGPGRAHRRRTLKVPAELLVSGKVWLFPLGTGCCQLHSSCVSTHHTSPQNPKRRCGFYQAVLPGPWGPGSSPRSPEEGPREFAERGSLRKQEVSAGCGRKFRAQELAPTGAGTELRSRRPSFLVTSVVLLDAREHLSADAVSNPPGPRTASSQPRGRDPSGTAPGHSTHFPVTLGRPEIDTVMCASLTGGPGPDPTHPVPSSHFLFLLAKVKQRETPRMLPGTPESGLGAGGLCELTTPGAGRGQGPPGHHPSIHSLIHPSVQSSSHSLSSHLLHAGQVPDPVLSVLRIPR